MTGQFYQILSHPLHKSFHIYKADYSVNSKVLPWDGKHHKPIDHAKSSSKHNHFSEQFQFTPDLFWIEKFVVIVDCLQLNGLLWTSATVWSWPYLWLTWTQYICLGNLDFYSTGLFGNNVILRISTTSHSSWSSMGGYLQYALIFAIANSAVYLIAWLYLTGYRWIKATIFATIAKENQSESMTKSYQSSRYEDAIKLGLYLLCYTIFLPTGLAVSRIYACDDDKVSIDPNITCLSESHLLYMILCTALVLPSFIGLPIHLYRSIGRNITFKHNQSDHEKYLQIHELTYLYQLESLSPYTYSDRDFVFFAPFRLPSAYHYCHMMILKGILMIANAYLRQHIEIQAISYLIVIAIYSFRYVCFRWPYRCDSTNIIHVTAITLLLGNTLIAAMNALGVRNFFLIASNQSYLLLSFNLLMVMVILYTIGFNITDPTSLYPPIRTIYHMISHDSLRMKASRWLDLLHDVEALKQDYIYESPWNYDVLTLEQAISQLKACAREAYEQRSILYNIINDKLLDLATLHTLTVNKSMRK